MNTPARQPPRFVPTLTERADPRGILPATSQTNADVETLVNDVWQHIQPMLAQRLREESEQWFRATLAQHLRDIHARIQNDIESLVRQAVMDTLKTHNRANLGAAPADI